MVYIADRELHLFSRFHFASITHPSSTCSSLNGLGMVDVALHQILIPSSGITDCARQQISGQPKCCELQSSLLFHVQPYCRLNALISPFTLQNKKPSSANYPPRNPSSKCPTTRRHRAEKFPNLADQATTILNPPPSPSTTPTSMADANPTNTNGRPPTHIPISLPLLAKMIDHSLLHPTMTDAEITAGLHIALKHNVAAACIKPYSIPLAKPILRPPPTSSTSDVVQICAVIAFPHGNSTTAIKVKEAEEAVKAGATEIDMVVNIGKVLSEEWTYVEDEIAAVNTAVVQAADGGLLKVIFETDFLRASHIVRLCEICTRVGVAFVKTSTGYGFVKGGGDGMWAYGYRGATVENVRLMRANVGGDVKVKAAGGVRTLDDLIRMRALGVDRVGATATVGILEEARRRGIGEEVGVVEVRGLEG